MSKHADKKPKDSKNITVNLNILSNINISLDGKSLICCIVSLISLIALVMFIRDSEACADIVRFLISLASNC